MFVQCHPDVTGAEADARLAAAGTAALLRAGGPEYLKHEGSTAGAGDRLTLTGGR